jgi:Flp pilus assembly protein CpaB
VKRQTLALVVIGLLLFIAGGGIAFETVEHGSKTPSTGSSGPVVPVMVPAVVVTGNVPSGTTGQDLVSQDLVAIQSIPQKTYLATDLPTLAGLTDQVLNKSLKKGTAIQTTDLTASTSTIRVPAGLDGITITAAGVAGLAGYLQPGSNIDLYANISKLSTFDNTGAEVPAGLAVPCVELVAPSLEVLDVSQIVAPSNSKPSASGRTIPANITLLLAVTPTQAQEITFMMQNETLSVAQTQKGDVPPAASLCMGTGQYTALP